MLLAETALRAVPNAPNLNFGEVETASATFRVYHRGAPAAVPLPVIVF